MVVPSGLQQATCVATVMFQHLVVQAAFLEHFEEEAGLEVVLLFMF